MYCTVGGRTALDIVTTVCRNAAATIAAGACAADGEFMRAHPNPTGSLGVGEAVPGLRFINMNGCPHNLVNAAAVLGADGVAGEGIIRHAPPPARRRLRHDLNGNPTHNFAEY